MLGALSLRASGLWPISLVALAAIGVATVLLYAPQVRAIRRPWHWLLPSLRGAALLAVAVSIVRPVLSRTKTVEEQGAIVLLVDRSLSMGVTDRVLGEKASERRRVLGQLLAIGDGLGRLPEGIRSRAVAGVTEDLEKLDSLAEDIVRARREVDYARLSGRGTREAQGRLEKGITGFLAAAKHAEQTARAIGSKQAVIDPLSRLARTPRPERREEWIRELRASIDRARAPAEESQAGIDEELYQSSQQVRWVCDDLSRLSRLGLSWEVMAGSGRSLVSLLDKRIRVVGFAVGDGIRPIPLRSGEETAKDAPVEADGITSDLSGGVRRAMSRMARQPVQAVVLFSDGRQTGDQGLLASGLLPSGVPIFTVDAAGGRVRDLAIEHVEMPRLVYAGEVLTARVTVRATGIEAGEIAGQAKLSPDGAEECAAPVRMKDGRVEAELRVRLDKAGLQRMVISIPAQAGEATLANNQVERWVKVVAQRVRVLALSGSPTWDSRYMRNALLGSPFVQLRDALLVPGVSALAMTRQDILQQDVVILNDLSKESLSIEQWDAIRELVSRHCGSVMVIPGIGHLQEEYSGHVMSDLLPYPAPVRPSWRIWPGGSARYHAALAVGSESVGATWLEDDPELGKRRWDELEGFYRYLAIPELKANARVLLMERESHEPLLTESRVGTGRVFFLAMSESWRWRQKVGERDQGRFWLQLIRHAAEEPYALASGPFYLDVDKVVGEPGEPVHVRAKAMSRLSDWSLPAAVEYTVVQLGRVVRTGELDTAGNADDGRYAAVINDLPVGEYELHVAAPWGNAVLGDLALPIKVERSRDLELGNISGDRQFLQRLAEASGGKCLNLEQVGMLPGLLKETSYRQGQVSELHLWSSYYLFLFVLSCLAAEWAIRKQVGLA